MSLFSAKKKVNKVQVEFPVAYYEENLLFMTDKSVWALYEIDSYVYDHLSEQQKIDKLITQTTFLSLLTNQCHLLWLPRTHDIIEHHERLKERLTHPANKKWSKRYIDFHADYLNKRYNDVTGQNNAVYQAYIAVYLPKSEEGDIIDQVGSAYSEIKKAIMDPIRMIENIAGLNEPEIYEHEFNTYLIKEQQIFDRLSRKMKVIRGTLATSEWLIKRNFWFGISDPVLRSQKDSEWQPKKTKGMRGGLSTYLYDSRQILTLTEGEVNASHPRRISITQPHNGTEKTVYQAYLALSDLPDAMDMPGSEWLYSAATLPFPVQMSVKVEVLESRDALKKLNKKKVDIENQVKNIREARATVPMDLQEKQERALLLEDELKKRKNPTFITHVTFGLYHTDMNRLKSNIKILQDHYRDFGNIHVELPAGDQWLLFNDFIPGSPRYSTDYIQRIPPETLASGMIGATQELGDGKGLFIGTTGALHHPVYFDPRNASQINRSPSFSITGTLGGGKSVLANLMAYQNAILGGKCLIFDPKGERTHWPEMLPELQEHIQVATLSSAKEDIGKLDPFIMLGDMEAAKEAAVEILAYLSSTKTNSVEYSYITQAIHKVAEMENPYLSRCIEELYEIGKSRDQAKLVAEILASFENLSFAKLLFGNGEQRTINMDFAINILQVQNLRMPSPEKLPENYSLDEKMSVALMFAIGRFANQFMYYDRSIFKMINMDEAWAFLRIQIGKQLADTIVRTGRSLNGGLGVITQNATDLAGDLAGNIGVKFAFRDSDTKKIKDTLSYFGLEHTQANIDMIKNLDNGQCLMQDIQGRIGLVRIDVVFQHIFDCFDTRPPEATFTPSDEEEHELSEIEAFASYYEAAAGESEDWNDEDKDDEDGEG